MPCVLFLYSNVVILWCCVVMNFVIYVLYSTMLDFCSVKSAFIFTLDLEKERHASIHHNISSIDVAREPAGKENDSISHLFRGTCSSKRNSIK